MLIQNRVKGKLFRHGRARGQGLVEFSMVLPILVMVLFAIIEFGFTFFQIQTLNTALRAGVRRGAVGANDTSVTTVVSTMCVPHVNITTTPNTVSLTVTNLAGTSLTPVNNQRPTGGKIRLTASYKLQFLTFLSGVAGNITVRPYAEMIIE